MNTKSHPLARTYVQFTAAEEGKTVSSHGMTLGLSVTPGQELSMSRSS